MKRGWTVAADFIRSWRFRVGATTERIALLNAAWEREFGQMAAHWRLDGIRRGILYVAPVSPAAALELRMRAPAILRELNKHFKTAWIKEIRTAEKRPRQTVPSGRTP